MNSSQFALDCWRKHSSHTIAVKPIFYEHTKHLDIDCFHRLLPQTICASQKKSFCSGAHVEASVNCNPVKNYTTVSFSPRRSEAKFLVSNQSLKKHSFSVGALVTPTAQDVSDTSSTLTTDDKIGVLLLNLGGPETLEDVQPFLFNLFADPVIL
jgi:ferrochelatase